MILTRWQAWIVMVITSNTLLFSLLTVYYDHRLDVNLAKFKDQLAQAAMEEKNLEQAFTDEKKLLAEEQNNCKDLAQQTKKSLH